MTMRLTQGTFSYLPDFDDADIRAQIRYAIRRGWAIGIEHTADPHPRNVYWTMWREPMFELADEAEAMAQIDRCRTEHRGRYVRVTAFDASYGRQTTALSFIVARPDDESGFSLARTELPGRRQAYSVRPRDLPA